MCMEDVRIGRESHGQFGDVTVANTITLLVPRDPHRIALILWGPASGSATISTNPGMTGAGGFHIGSGEGGIVLNVQHHGDMVRRAWYAIHSVGSVVMHYEATTLAKE